MKTIKLLYPEWQGYGIDNHASDGAFTMHGAFMQGSKFVEIDVPRKEHLLHEGGILGRSSIIKNSKYVTDRLDTEQPDRIFMIGGTCGSEIAPVAYLNQRYHGDLAVLWFDAHGDLNTPEKAGVKKLGSNLDYCFIKLGSNLDYCFINFNNQKSAKELSIAMLNNPHHLGVFLGNDEKERLEIEKMFFELFNNLSDIVFLAKENEKIIGVMHW